MAKSNSWAPYVSWAQRKDRLFVTVEIENPENVKAEVQESPGKLSLSAKGGPSGSEKRPYSLDIEFYGDVSKEDSKQSIEPRFVFFMVMKKESGPHWPRLTKDKNQYKGFIRTDWTRFIDEEDEEEENKGDMGGIDLSQLGNMSDLGDLGGQGEDSDDEELPDLEGGSSQ